MLCQLGLHWVGNKSCCLSVAGEYVLRLSEAWQACLVRNVEQATTIVVIASHAVSQKEAETAVVAGA